MDREILLKMIDEDYQGLLDKNNIEDYKIFVDTQSSDEYIEEVLKAINYIYDFGSQNYLFAAQMTKSVCTINPIEKTVKFIYVGI